MAIEGSGVELGEDVDLIDPGVDAVGHWDVNEAVGTANGDGGFGSVLGERVETGACSSSKNDSCEGWS